MRIGGIEVNEPNEQILVLPRAETNVVFRARAVPDFTEFLERCPAPTPPTVVTQQGARKNEDDESYRRDVEIHNSRRLAWLVVKSLEPSGIEWEAVDPESPGTWSRFSDEFRSAGFSHVEIQRIIGLVMEVNCLSEEKLEWARSVFLAGQQTSPAG